jgi:hypothetical protein
MSGVVIVPWYATGFRADSFEAALDGIAAVALRYGAESYAVYRARDDRFKFQQLATFEHHIDWERYWGGPEMVDFRVLHSGWYQVPVVYGWWDLTISGAVGREPLAMRNGGNGAVHGESAGAAGDPGSA